MPANREEEEDECSSLFQKLQGTGRVAVSALCIVNARKAGKRWGERATKRGAFSPRRSACLLGTEQGLPRTIPRCHKENVTGEPPSGKSPGDLLPRPGSKSTPAQGCFAGPRLTCEKDLGEWEMGRSSAKDPGETTLRLGVGSAVGHLHVHFPGTGRGGGVWALHKLLSQRGALKGAVCAWQVVWVTYWNRQSWREARPGRSRSRARTQNSSRW